MVADVTNATGDEELATVTGPVHAYELTFEGLVAVNVNVAVAHIGALLLMPLNDGAGLMVTVCVTLQPEGKV